MTDLQTRVHSGLGSDWDSAQSPWEGLMRLYEADREALYLLACDGLGGGGDEVTRPLADLARQVRSAVRGTYRVEQHDGSGESVIKPRSGETLSVPDHLVARVRQFLLEIDGKGSSDRAGKDYEGRPVSEAEVRFKLGEPARAGKRTRTAPARSPKRSLSCSGSMRKTSAVCRLSRPM